MSWRGTGGRAAPSHEEWPRLESLGCYSLLSRGPWKGRDKLCVEVVHYSLASVITDSIPEPSI